MDLQIGANLECAAGVESTIDTSTMTSATSKLPPSSLACAVFAVSLALATPIALRAQSVAPAAAAQKSEKMAKPDAATEKASGAKSLAAKRQKLRDCGAKWQDEKKAKGLTGKAAYLKFLSACING
jgi:hypothetical protein